MRWSGCDGWMTSASLIPTPVSFSVMETLACRVAMSFDQDFLIAGFSVWHHQEY